MNFKGFISVAVVLSCLFKAGCTTIRYTSDENVRVTLTKRPKHLDKFEYQDKVRFYLWGLYPSENVVKIDLLTRSEGFKSLSKLKIEEYLEWDDWLYMVVTLGMYTPRTYRLTGLAQK